MDKQSNNLATDDHMQFPPVVAVLGHVDHGKTSLLDAVRKTSIVDREHGGITQKIGASTVEILHDGVKQRITFIDTPGHEAFSKMRGRGAQAADIGLLIVSSADGVMPQTKESIQLLKQANIPYIVVLTKADLPTKNPERVKQQIMQEDILLEGMGGDVPVMEISSRTGQNVKELLDLILLVWELNKPDRTLSPDASLQAIVIESKLDLKSGPRATVVIKNGTISQRDDLVSGGEEFRVRTLLNEQGKQLQTATIGDAVELLGMKQAPSVGSLILSKAAAEAIVETQANSQTAAYSPNAPEHGLAVILTADTEGSLEAIGYSLPKDVYVISKRTGEVSESDVMLAKSTGAIILSFNLKLRPDVQKLAMTEKVLARNYNIIYEMIDEIKDVLEGKRLALLEEVYGTARVLARFPFEKTFAMGISVMDGRIARGDRIRVLRNDEPIGEATITSLRIGKNPTSKVEKGKEAGAVLGSPLDFQPGDVIISHS